MLIYDVKHPEVFFNADRADTRWGVIQGLLNSIQENNFVGFITQHGNPGDYLPQGFIFHFVGRIGLIIFQITLVLISGHAVYRIAQNIGLNDKASVTSGGIYLLLPHTLIFPHQLASEAVYTPLLMISLWLTSNLIHSGSLKKAGVSGSFIGIANLVRPVTLLWPVVITVLLINFKKIRQAALYLLVAFLPVIAWMSFMNVNTGQFTMGESSRDLGHNLYNRISRISKTMPSNGAEQVRKLYLKQSNEGQISAREYLRFALDFPGPFIQHVIRDSLIFFSKSGIERITIDYLALNVEKRELVQDKRYGWRSLLEKEGLGATISYLWQTLGVILIISVIGAFMMVGFSLLALYGAKELLVEYIHMDLSKRFVALILLALPIYIFVISQAVNAMQSRHRAPAEAAFIILSVYGINNIIKRRTSPTRS